jgi:hypothetical protein
MRFFFPGFLAGAAAALFFFIPVGGVEIHPEWWSQLNAIPAIQKSPYRKPAGPLFFVKIGDRDYFRLRGNGEVALSGAVTDGLSAFSGDGRFYVKYLKAGTSLEMFNAKGDRFWKIESLEYPYLSHAGRLILLMNGDQSGIRALDENGNQLPAHVSGRVCTAVAFPQAGDCAGVGFFDGSYYFISSRGIVTGRGRTPAGTMVKSMAVSGNGAYAAVHYGNNTKDYIRIVDIAENDYEDEELKHIHPVKTGVHVADDGYCTVIDVDRVLFISPSGRIRYSIAVPPKRPGHSAITCNDGMYAVSYTMQNGTSKLIMYNQEGVILFSREFPSESFLDATLRDGLLFLRGSDNIYCYSIHGI